MDIRVVDGDITQVQAGALITAHNAESTWLGGIDGMIAEIDNHYHAHFARELALDTTADITAVCVEKHPDKPHTGAFDDVIFVLDEPRTLPIGTVVKRGLDTAIKHGHESVSMPVFRQGIMRGVYSTPVDDVEAMADTLKTYVDCGIPRLTVVTHHNPALHYLFYQALAM